jgi:hypothetical protein
VITTEAQRLELRAIYDQRPLTHADNILTYDAFLATVQESIFDGVRVECGGMLWGVEADGFVHSTPVYTPPPSKKYKTLKEYKTDTPPRDFAVCKPPPLPFRPEYDGNYNALYEAGEHNDAIPSGGISEGLYSQAETMHDRVGIELLALGKPAGDIFNPEHWMYDSIRESSGTYVDGSARYWNSLIND